MIPIDGRSRPLRSRRCACTIFATLDRYGHLYPDADERARARLDELIDGARADDEHQEHEGDGDHQDQDDE